MRKHGSISSVSSAVHEHWAIDGNSELIYNILKSILRKQSHCFFNCPSHFYNVKQRKKIHSIYNLKNDITFLIPGLEKKLKLHMKCIFKLFPTVPVLMQSKEVFLSYR